MSTPKESSLLNAVRIVVLLTLFVVASYRAQQYREAMIAAEISLKSCGTMLQAERDFSLYLIRTLGAKKDSLQAPVDSLQPPPKREHSGTRLLTRL